MSVTEPPLYVDLDGSLIRTDLLHESCLALLRRNPLTLLLLPLWLLRGRARLKAEIAARVDLDVASLPLNPGVAAFLRDQAQAGRRLVLATASHASYAEKVAERMGCFSGVLASDAHRNLSGTQKLAQIQQQCAQGEFDYLGNARADLPIWQAARYAYVAAAPAAVINKARRIANVQGEFKVSSNPFRAFFRAMRLHQWLKNLLLFVPLLAGHHWQDVELLKASLLAFVAFGLVASSGYVFNDLLDLESDRQHPTKSRRPLASGDLPVAWGVAAMPLLWLVATAIAVQLPYEYRVVLACYLVLTISYTLWLKRMVMLDVAVLALLYTLRILAGAAATSIVPSFWLLAFSLFIFLSLAILKRYAELLLLKSSGQQTAARRGYFLEDLSLLGMLGTSSGLLSVLVLALYINSEGIRLLYRYPEMIWFLCPLMLYWVGRVWFKAHRGHMHDDPVVFAATDPVSLLTVALAAIFLVMAV